MLVSLSMKCWRQHRDRAITFTPGLNAVRGPNEGGKTSMLLAIVYALFGVKAMPQSLVELVTWGCNVRELKVTLILSLRGELYEFSRSDSGAECKHSGGIVVGQNEVSKFAEELLGVDRAMATGMMFASQGGLRGALSEGPKALSQYIESLSGMDLFDRLLERAAERLTTGPSRAIDEEIAKLEADIEALDLTMPSVEAQNGEIANIEAQILTLSEDLAGEASMLVQAQSDLAAAKVQHEVREAAVQSLARAEQSALAQFDLVEKLKGEACAIIDTDRIEALQGVLNGVEGRQVQADLYKRFLALPVYPEAYWEGDAESMRLEMKGLRERIEFDRDYVGLRRADIREARAKLVSASNCGYCGQDFSQFPEVAAKNDLIEKNCARWEGEIAAKEASVKVLEADYKALERIPTTPFFDFVLRAIGNDSVSVDDNFVPPKITWIGEVPQELPNITACRAELKDLQDRQQARLIAQARLDQAETTLYGYQQEVVRLRSTMMPAIPLAPMQGMVDTHRAACDSIKGAIQAFEKRILAIQAEKTRLMFGYEMNKQRWRDLNAALDSKREARRELLFNNTLVKKIRAARPIVASQLWEIVLASVSTMFSKVRGTQSVVARTATGFTVNGHSVTGLSGSALDVLGMALRVALVKSFVPDCSFLIMDEPMSACDDERTAAMIGFLSACDFDQTILITHESLTEANANNLILI